MPPGVARAMVRLARIETSRDASELATRLRALGASVRRDDAWLMVGNPRHAAGWKLHVSATPNAVDLLFERVLPCLVQRGADFKMAAGRDAIVQLSAGNFGEGQIGKVITVYPRNNAQAAILARELIERTREIVGPRIATDLYLGGSVYARYGAVHPRIVHDRFGEPTELIPDGNGNWIPDLRSVPFKCPPGIPIPFPTAAVVQAPARRNARLVGGRYFVTDVLRPGIPGSVLRAVDLRNPRKPTACILKQARPHFCADELGRDYRARIRHEGRVIARLRGLKGIAAGGEYFDEEDDGYLPIAYVPGSALSEAVDEFVAGRPWMRVPERIKRRFLRYAAQLVRRLRSAHARGVIHRDVAPSNVWIADDGCVYLLDWECAHVMRSRIPAFRLGTPGFSDLSVRERTPTVRADWQACGRVIAFILTGLDPAAFIHGRPRELETRLIELTEMRDAKLIGLLARTLADKPVEELDAAKLSSALASTAHARINRCHHLTAPLFTTGVHDSTLAEGLEILTAEFGLWVARLRVPRTACEAAMIDAHSGIAGMLYVLAAAHRAHVAHLDGALGEQAARLLMTRAQVTPELPGLVHGRAGRALAVAAAVQAGCVSDNDGLRRNLARALDGRIDWPDFTHGAAGQGFAALACAQRLGLPKLAASAAACAKYLVCSQDRYGSWTLPEGVEGVSGGRYTGFAHGAAGVMGFLASYAATRADAAAEIAWRRAESWLIKRSLRGRGGRLRWPQSDSHSTISNWWCHGAPGIALGWLCVAQAQGTSAIAEEYLRGALGATPPKLRSDSLSQCHGLAGIGEIYLQAHRVLGEPCWLERAADVANVVLALFRKRSRQPWHYLSDEPPGSAGLMLGTTGILHFLLRYQTPTVVTAPPLLS
jgi:tRNA A-37 threonylcarbamoyl transferase component Bud32